MLENCGEAGLVVDRENHYAAEPVRNITQYTEDTDPVLMEYWPGANNRATDLDLDNGQDAVIMCRQ